MRAGFLLSEVRIGLRRNLTMTFAVVVTTAISLSLLGIGLLSNAHVGAMKDYWYDKIEVSVFLCGPLSESPSCAGGVVTDAQRTTIKADQAALPVVQSVYYESQSEAFSRFQERFKDSAIAQNVSADQLPESFRVKLDDPTQFAVVVSAFTGRPGVDVVQDQGQILYQASTGETDKYEYDVCQWSPQGTYLLVLKRVYVAVNRKIIIYNSNPRGEVYVLRAQVYRVEENRGRLSFKELNGVSGILHDAVDHHQLTGNFFYIFFIGRKKPWGLISQIKIFFFSTENLWLDDNSFLWTTSLGLPLFRCHISPAKKGVPAFIEKKILLNKSGHCRLASAPTGCEENIAYSGSKKIIIIFGTI